jgi:hypothetical protein
VTTYKMKLFGIIALFLSLAVIAIMPATAADEVSVIRVLPDTVAPGDEFTVELTQSGFLADAGIVVETLPDDFGYVANSLTGKASGEYEGHNLTIAFRDETIVTYNVTAGTADQIGEAVFSGTYKTSEYEEGKLKDITGDVGGDTTLTVTEPTPTPTPTATSASGNGGGGSNGGGTVSTPTPSPTPTATSGVTPSASLEATQTVSPGVTVVPTVSPTPSPVAAPSPISSPTSKPLIPGFEAVFAVAGLLVIAHLVIRRGYRGKRFF